MIRDMERRVRTSQPIPRLKTELGIYVALPYLYAAIKPPVDCHKKMKVNERSPDVLVQRGTSENN